MVGPPTVGGAPPRVGPPSDPGAHPDLPGVGVVGQKLGHPSETRRRVFRATGARRLRGPGSQQPRRGVVVRARAVLGRLAGRGQHAEPGAGDWSEDAAPSWAAERWQRWLCRARSINDGELLMASVLRRAEEQGAARTQAVACEGLRLAGRLSPWRAQRCDAHFEVTT